ncbi:Cytoplasmic dynein 1 intermediate chain 2, variant 3 [Schistosoma haematobium]|uniref:Cytoplasmic dynein 1 intermediate chain 2, variant 3 n=2 Tax=Schistosoma haematobium TaxID=6185 RepID=A0A922LMD5_SCHHA|nr:Cytoplasmic dynein 1 intermediate chain 2, variant 3 [Schistosoma haematobium]KAH9589793.1 Cytoplasmic dynein 1 intermediate chain 2, variant 3 [Schistosoma haematobium]
MSDRKAELERKKAKLLAMREEKKKREEIKKTGIYDAEASDIRQTTEELLKDLGLPEPVVPQASNIRELESPSLDTIDGVLQRNSKKRKNLQVSDVFEIAIPPPETIIYSKETQTLEEPQEREILTYDEGNRDEVDANAALAELEKMPHIGVTKTGQSRGILDKIDGIRTSTDGVDENTSNDIQRNDIIPMSEEEKAQLLSSDAFLRFFERSSRIIERAICHPDEGIFLDYSGQDLETEESDELLTVSNEFFDERWSKHRTITGLDWSTIFPELLLTAYHMNEEAVHEPEGVCLMWNMKYPKKLTPEFIFHCQSPVTSASLSRFHPNIVVGGTYSGQIVLWDSRVNKRTPVQRSPLTSWAHTHPVFAITLIGTQNAHNIISLGSDGSLCAWSLEMLAQPREKSKVCEMSSGGLFDLYPTCMSFFANDVNNYAVGAENGNAYCGQRHSSRTGVAEETSRHVPYKGHGAPLTAISTHPSPCAFSFSSLFLTASLDWTVRLWSTREHKPIHTFDDYSDYVYDVCWSPIHPAVFSAVDGTGNLDIWDMNQDAEIPVARRKLGLSSNVDTSSSSSSGLVGVALNKCRWNIAGTHVAVGDDTGRVTVCNVHESLSQPATDDWSSFAHVLSDLKHYEMEPEVETEA